MERERIGHALRDGLEGRERTVELLAVRDVLGRDADGLLRTARAHRAERDGRVVEDRPQRRTVVERPAEQRVRPDLHVGERDLESGFVRHGVLPTEGDPGRLRVEDEHAATLKLESR